MIRFFSLLEAILTKVKPNLILFVLLLFFLAREILGYVIAYIDKPEANQLIVGALLGHTRNGSGRHHNCHNRFAQRRLIFATGPTCARTPAN